MTGLYKEPERLVVNGTTDGNFPTAGGVEWDGGCGTVMISGTYNDSSTEIKLQTLDVKSSNAQWIDVPASETLESGDQMASVNIARKIFIRAVISNAGGGTDLDLTIYYNTG